MHKAGFTVVANTKKTLTIVIVFKMDRILQFRVKQTFSKRPYSKNCHVRSRIGYCIFSHI